MDARAPPTERWPLSDSRPAAFASVRNFFSRSSPPESVNGTFMSERYFSSTGET